MSVLPRNIAVHFWMGVTCVMLAAYLPSPCDAAPEAGNPGGTANKEAVDAKAVQALIAQLGDSSFKKREAAHKKLAALGELAMDLLQKAGNENPDPEVRNRAGQLIAAIEVQLFPVVRSVRVTGSWATRIALTPDGAKFISVGADTLDMGDFVSGTRAMGSAIGNRHLYWCVAVSTDGKRAIGAGRERIARVFDLTTGKQVRELVGHQGEIWGTAPLPDGKRAVTGGKDKSLRLWDLATGTELAKFAGVKEDIRCLALSPDGKTIAAGHIREGNDPMGTLRLWDVEKRQEIKEFPGHTLEVSGVAFSPDGKRIVTSSFDKTVRVWEVASGRELKRFDCGCRMECAIFVNGGRRVLCAGNRDDPTLQLWDVEQSKRILRSPPMEGSILGIAALPDGTSAVTAGRDAMIRLWHWKR